MGHFCRCLVAKNKGFVWGSVFLMLEKDPFGLCYDHYTSAVFG